MHYERTKLESKHGTTQEKANSLIYTVFIGALVNSTIKIMCSNRKVRRGIQEG